MCTHFPLLCRLSAAGPDANPHAVSKRVLEPVPVRNCHTQREPSCNAECYPHAQSDRIAISDPIINSQSVGL